ncbi:MAG TPA: hypothetical protein PKL31_01850 [Fulvivirga sp.]|nr:hypothetical protein [Fulvivirga sp.]
MDKFELSISPELQGKFELKEVNLVFVFQVNCPGCFMYGIPIVNRLYRAFLDKVGFIGISTAFEDFDFNTAAATKLLLEKGETVGETRRYLDQAGQQTYSDIPQFPVAFDTLLPINSALEKVLDNVYKTHKNLDQGDVSYRNQLISRLESYYKSMPFIAQTFTMNQLKGTPSFIVFDADYTIIDESFGHIGQEKLENVIKEQLKMIVSN